MKIKEVIGIDVSKLTIDVAIHKIKKHKKFANNEQGFTEMIEWLEKIVDLPATTIIV